MSSRHATLAHIGSNQTFIERVCVRIVDIIVDTCLIVETSWLPEFLNIATLMVNVEGKLREITNQEQTEEV
jgi:hypothetical protein